MKNQLSILIPVYNYDCTSLVDGLCRQIPVGVEAEIIIADDGSTDEISQSRNAALADRPRCRYIRHQQNVGRAAIRNFLAQSSRYEWLLFLDCDMQLPHSHFVSNYLADSGDSVTDGGFGVCENEAAATHNLRYRYEWSSQSRHTVAQRRAHPYRSFRTTNFMIRRDIMMSHPFDERFVHYGYEDVLFGKTLEQAGIDIRHIDNAMMLSDLETNNVFVAKTEESLRTLYLFRDDLRGYSRLLDAAEHANGFVRWGLRLWHRMTGRLERCNLCGQHPNLTIFKLYKIGYYLTL